MNPGEFESGRSRAANLQKSDDPEFYEIGGRFVCQSVSC